MGVVLTIVYEVWAIYSGYKVVSGRFEWLEDERIFNKIVKFAVCFFVGNLIGAFYLLYLPIKFIFNFFK
ncbi:MAG: hypothetical protein ACI4TG_00390 [Ruminococcus sp.]